MIRPIGVNMSLNSLTDEALRLTAPRRSAGVVRAEGVPKARVDNNAATAISKLVKYIPTESITLYVAAVSAFDSLNGKWGWITHPRIYWFFAILTPILWIVFYIAKRKAANLPPMPPISLWLVWNLIASFVAFLIWALAVPNNTYLEGTNGGVIAGFLAVFISSVLSIVELLIDTPPDPELDRAA
jgi:hypothetical protein